MTRILDVKARQVLDSRGNPTVEVDVRVTGAVGSAIVPSGASTGIHEALELRDGGKAYGGKGVKKAIKHINTTLKKVVMGMDARKQARIDGELIHADGTENKKKLGANAILGVSMAVARAAAASQHIPLYNYLADLAGTKPSLPVPYANVINGGRHAVGTLEFQEFMIVPTGAKSFSQATRMVSETYHALKTLIAKKYGKTAIFLGDEGGFAPQVENAEEALNLLVAAIKKAGYTGKIKIAMDAAASEFYHKKNHSYLKEQISPRELQDYYLSLAKKYPLICLEDPFDQDDSEAFNAITKATKKRKNFQIVGDDITVTNPVRIKRAIAGEWCNALLLKVNQIGTVTESLNAARMSFKAGWAVMVSHRSGETEDPFIADLATALGCGQIKLGAPARGERTAKYNQLLRIEEFMGKKAKYGKK